MVTFSSRPKYSSRHFEDKICWACGYKYADNKHAQGVGENHFLKMFILDTEKELKDNVKIHLEPIYCGNSRWSELAQVYVQGKL